MSNGALSPSTAASTKNNHRKSMDKGEKEKDIREKERERDKSAHNHDMSSDSIKCPSNKYSHTNGSVHHGDIEIIERLG